jgi:hypothetical protein
MHHPIKSEFPKDPLVTQTPAEVAGRYLRVFEQSVAQMHQFDPFIETLRKLVQSDAYFNYDVNVSLEPDSDNSLPDFDRIDADQVVFPIAGKDKNYGHITYRARYDGHPFEADDLHLIGSISRFVATLTGQANRFQKSKRQAALLEYLFNQLPLPVICYDQTEAPILINDQASQLLDSKTIAELRKRTVKSTSKPTSNVSIHLEQNGQLLYAEGHTVTLPDESTITAYVLYELSRDRNQLITQLERSIYQTEARGGNFSILLLEDNQMPGRAFKTLKEHAHKITSSDASIHPLDAFTSACIIDQCDRPETLKKLRNEIAVNSDAPLKVSLLSIHDTSHKTGNADVYIQQARAQLADIQVGLLPEIGVFENTNHLTESLRMILSDQARILRYSNLNTLAKDLEANFLSAVLIDLDQVDLQAMEKLITTNRAQSRPVHFIYFTYRQPAMVLTQHSRLIHDDLVVQKPFDADYISEALNRLLHLA